jgi:predicted RNA binding protein YcfA (HicA-like mRNA interferase family)
MTRREKLIAKIRARPVEADYEDVKAVLELFGWVEDRSEGSHHVFVKTGCLPITVPKKHGKKVKRHYLSNICDILGLDDKS